MIKVFTSSENKILIQFPHETRSLDTTHEIVAKILNFISSCFPCLTQGVAAIQLNQRIYYVRRSSLARTLQCDPHTPCSNVDELKALALKLVNRTHATAPRSSITQPAHSEQSSLPSSEANVPSSIAQQGVDIHQGMVKAIADKQKSDAEARDNLKLHKEQEKFEDSQTIQQIRAQISHLPTNHPRRIESENFIKRLQETRESMFANLDEIATACGIAPS